MKKTIVIVILVVYIASIAVVNFFGLKIKEFEGVEYVEEIRCDSITVLNETPITMEPKKISAPDENGNSVSEFYFDFISGTYTDDAASLAANPNRIRLNYDVLPHTADTSSIAFVCKDVVDKDGNLLVQFDSATQTVVFLEPWVTIEITIKATDGRKALKTIKIMGME